ncbi:MAG: DNA (cytosine-5)-methyltransferase 1 [Parvicella sp.]|jgi:DNA (cytosine-5)-methyltransferase 1
MTDLKKIPIIDLFAGPGGLGEGFMSLMNPDGKSTFDIRLSIEKDVNAHKTLVWRSFYRQFRNNGKEIPPEYYLAYKEADIVKREEIIEFALSKYPEGEIARNESRLVELGSDDWPKKVVDGMIKEQLGDTNSWVLIGGPPCQAYSNVGRSRVGGIDKEDQRVYLYQEYLRIIKEHKPAVFVMENVKGLLSAKVDDEKVFDWMKKDLAIGGEYKIHSCVKPVQEDRDFLIRSEKFGVPQKRHRVILLGIRSDYEHQGKYLAEKEEVTLESVIGEMPEIRSGLNREFLRYHPTDKYQNGNAKRVYKNLDDSDENWEKYLTKYISKIKEWGDLNLNGLSNGPKQINAGIGSEFVSAGRTLSAKHPLDRWYNDIKLKGLANHKSRAHLTQDLLRYLFASLYVEKNGTFPRMDDYARHSKDLVPDHVSATSGKFNDRFRVQVKERPATTITSHISKDGHYFIHYDPKQCRSLTVREAARIQTFPDNYLFRGSRTQQFHQVGNAVPPYLSFQLAEIVLEIVRSNTVKK